MKWLTLISALLINACSCVQTDVLEPSQITVVPEQKNKIKLTTSKDSIDVSNNKKVICY